VAGLDGGSHHASRSLAACRRRCRRAAQPQRYLTNDEAADYLRLSPRTLEQRVIGGGPRSASSAAASCTPWPTSMPGPPTQLRGDFRSRIRRAPLGGQPCALIAARGWPRHVQPRCRAAAVQSANSSTCSAPAGRHGAARQPGLDGLSVLLAGEVAAHAPIDFRAAASRSAWRARRSTASPRSGMPTC
jgi:hypothetical protein